MRESFVFYGSFYEALRELNAKDRVAVYDAVCRLALYGEEAQLRGVPAAILTLIRPQIEANNKRYANGIKGAEGGRRGGRPRCPKETPKGFLEEDSGEESENPKETPSVGFENPKETPNDNVNENENVNDNENDNVNVNAPALQQERPPAREKHGRYGWVRLTGEEHRRLLQELGAAELERCIGYIDELAQSTGNKNKWRDWNLVLRRCAREGWGKREEKGGNLFLEMAKERGIVP